MWHLSLAAAHPDFLSCSRSLAVGGASIMSRTPVASGTAMEVRAGSASATPLADGGFVVAGSTLFVRMLRNSHQWYVRVTDGNGGCVDSSSRSATVTLSLATAGLDLGTAQVTLGHTNGFSAAVQVIGPLSITLVAEAPSQQPSVALPSEQPTAAPSGLTPTAAPEQDDGGGGGSGSLSTPVVVGIAVGGACAVALAAASWFFRSYLCGSAAQAGTDEAPYV